MPSSALRHGEVRFAAIFVDPLRCHLSSVSVDAGPALTL
jgi:hypothetical protein